MTLRLTTLGHPSVTLGSDEITSLPGKPVAFGLFVFLAVEREATRDRLVSMFWPETTQEKARHALSQALYDLRQTIGQEWAVSAGNTVQVVDSLWVDCLEFSEMAEAGRTADAVSLYAGPFLEGVYLAQTHAFQEWVDRNRARLSRRFRATVDAQITECRARGDCEAALQSAWKWVGLDPLDDGGQQHLIRLLAETGSRPEALAQYERYRKLLETELGLEPLEEMLGLVEAIREGIPQSPRPPEAESGPEETPESLSWPLPTSKDTEARSVLKPSDDLKELQEQINAELPAGLEILRPLGEGSMALVLLGRQPHLRRLVAVKVLSPRHYADAKARKRFEREAQAAARIQHPHVCTVFEVGSLRDGTPYQICPFIKGTTLAQRLKAEGRLGAPEVRRVLREIASALAAAHKLGIVHRDVRPANVLRADDTGSHSLCDFGLAGVLETGDASEPKITSTGELLGHPAYISPEQIDGEPLTDRADVYSLGVMGYELLTGHTPAGRSEDPKGREKRTAAVELSPLVEFMADTDPELAELIGRCLAKDPAHRPSAADVARKLAVEPPSSPHQGSESLTEVSLLRLLFKKRLPQIMGAYVAGAWIAVEAASEFQNRGSIREWLFWVTAVTALFGFFAVSVVGWFHGEKGPQRMPKVERWLLGVLGVGWVVSSIWVLARF